MKKTWLFWDLPAEAVDAIRDLEGRSVRRELELIEALIEAQTHGPLTRANHWHHVTENAPARRNEIKEALETLARVNASNPTPCTPVGQGDSCNGFDAGKLYAAVEALIVKYDERETAGITVTPHCLIENLRVELKTVPAELRAVRNSRVRSSWVCAVCDTPWGGHPWGGHPYEPVLGAGGYSCPRKDGANQLHRWERKR